VHFWYASTSSKSSGQSRLYGSLVALKKSQLVTASAQNGASLPSNALAIVKFY